MFRFILSFFFKPFNKKIKNKTRSSIFAPLKFSLKFIGGFVLLCTLVVVCVDVISGVNPNAGDKVTIKRVKSKNKEGLYENNPNGTVNGLNLMLINNIQTEGYVKEILTLYRDSAENKLDDYEFQVPLEYKIGIQIDETGPYSGTLLPKSYLPTKNGVVVWKQSFDGIPAEQMTVENLNPDNAISLVGRYPEIYGSMSYNVGTSAYQGLYQNAAGTEVNGYGASKLNWLGSSSGRGARTYYQPDGMSYLNGRITNFVNNFFTDEYIAKLKENPNIVNMCVAPIHNAGEAGFLSPLVYGSHWSDVSSYDSGSIYLALESLYNDLDSAIKKYPKLRSKYFGHGGRFVGAYLLCESGWNFTADGLGFLENSSGLTSDVSSTLLGEGKTPDDLMNYFRSKVSSLPISDSEAISNYGWSSASQPWLYYGSNSSKGFMFKYDPNKTVTLPSGKTMPFLSVMNNESLGQLYSTLFQGSYIYAVALKYAGVDVDPTDPNSYMNTIPDGEWKPSGDTAWMSQYGINPSDIGPKRTAVLNEGYKWLGSLYTQYNGNADGSQKPPQKDENGNWIDRPYENGFDCSGYMQYIFRTALGIDITRTTYSQYPNVDNMEFIDESEAKPGDLIYYFYPNDLSTEHVSMYLGKDPSNGLDRIMHAPYFGERLKITSWNGYPGTRRVFKRVKGID